MKQEKSSAAQPRVLCRLHVVASWSNDELGVLNDRDGDGITGRTNAPTNLAQKFNRVSVRSPLKVRSKSAQSPLILLVRSKSAQRLKVRSKSAQSPLKVRPKSAQSRSRKQRPRVRLNKRTDLTCGEPNKMIQAPRLCVRITQQTNNHTAFTVHRSSSAHPCHSIPTIPAPLHRPC